MPTTDPRPADLTAQERVAIRQAGLRAFPDCIEASVDELLAFLGAAIAAVPRLAAPSRGQGRQQDVSDEVNESARGVVGIDPHGASPAVVSPAPVASPEVPETDGSFGSMVPVRQVKLPVPAPAGPETGEPRETSEVLIHLRNLCEDDTLGTEADEAIDRAITVIESLRSALSAATERAEAAERERDTISCNAIPSSPACEDGLDRRKYNEPVCWSCYSAVTGRLHATEDLLTASESRCAVALKLAGELYGSLQSAVARLGSPTGSMEYTRTAEYAARLAALSSPSAPESDNG